VPDDEALGSKRENSLGMRRGEPPWAQRCEERWETLRRVTPPLRTEKENDRIDEGTLKGQEP